jgi:type I restriction enzyme S subunit
MSAIIDYRGKTPRKTAAGVPLITAKVVKGGRIETPDEFIDASEYDEWMRRGLPQVGDVVITTEAPLGEVAQLSESRIALAQRLILLRGKPGLLDNTYLKYLLMSDELQKQLVSRASGTTVVGIKQSELRRVTLSLPPIDEQQATAAVLGALDGKIEQNRRTGRALEGLAQAQFKAWFVDFEPVKAKAAGAASFPGIPAETFAALPDYFVDSPIGPVPQGWAVRSLSKVATFLNGLALQKYPPVGDGSDLPVIKIAELRKGATDGAGLANASVPNAYVVEDGDLLFSWSGTLEAALWYGGRGALNQHLFKVTSDTYPCWLCLHWIRQHLPEFRLIASSKATTMGHIKRSHLDNAQVIVPDDSFVQAANDAIGPLYDLHANLALETRKLAALRDYLLPRLLSGAVRVKSKGAS